MTVAFPEAGLMVLVNSGKGVSKPGASRSCHDTAVDISGPLREWSVTTVSGGSANRDSMSELRRTR